MSSIRVAIIGVGNCASSLVQGVHFYRDATADDFVPGLMHVDLGGYRPRDIEFSAAFDVSAHKVGLDLAEAIHVPYQRVNELVNRKRGVTPSTALRLSKFFGTSAAFWLNLQLRWDLYHASRTEAAELKRIKSLQIPGEATAVSH